MTFCCLDYLDFYVTPSLISFDYSISYFFYLFKVYLTFLLCRFNITISA